MDIRYLAGLLDADGSFCICKDLTSKVKIEIRERGLLKEIKHYYGGNLSKESKRDDNAPTTTLAWTSSLAIKELLTKLIPELKIKKEQARYVLANSKLTGRPDKKSTRKWLYKNCKKLNKKQQKKKYEAQIPSDRRYASEELLQEVSQYTDIYNFEDCREREPGWNYFIG